MARNGKIAGLPHKVREELNQRMLDGGKGDRLLAWLNELPAVKKALAAEFGGKPITKQNLSDWRNGGFLEWQARTDLLGKLDGAKEEVGAVLESTADGERALGDMLAVRLEARLMVMVGESDRGMDEKFMARLKGLNSMGRLAVRLRKGDHTFKRHESLRTATIQKNRSDEDMALTKCVAEAQGHRLVKEAFAFATDLLTRWKAGERWPEAIGVHIPEVWNEAIRRKRQVDSGELRVDSGQATGPTLGCRDFGDGWHVIDFATGQAAKAGVGSCQGLSVAEVAAECRRLLGNESLQTTDIELSGQATDMPMSGQAATGANAECGARSAECGEKGEEVETSNIQHSTSNHRHGGAGIQGDGKDGTSAECGTRTTDMPMSGQVAESLQAATGETKVVDGRGQSKEVSNAECGVRSAECREATPHPNPLPGRSGEGEDGSQGSHVGDESDEDWMKKDWSTPEPGWIETVEGRWREKRRRFRHKVKTEGYAGDEVAFEVVNEVAAWERAQRRKMGIPEPDGCYGSDQPMSLRDQWARAGF